MCIANVLTYSVIYGHQLNQNIDIYVNVEKWLQPWSYLQLPRKRTTLYRQYSPDFFYMPPLPVLMDKI